jgi:hypothetical protein
MDKLQLTGQNLGRVFKFRRGCIHVIQLYYFETKLPKLKLKTRPKQLLGSLLVDIMLPAHAEACNTAEPLEQKVNKAR